MPKGKCHDTRCVVSIVLWSHWCCLVYVSAHTPVVALLMLLHTRLLLPCLCFRTHACCCLACFRSHACCCLAYVSAHTPVVALHMFLQTRLRVEISRNITMASKTVSMFKTIFIRWCIHKSVCTHVIWHCIKLYLYIDAFIKVFALISFGIAFKYLAYLNTQLENFRTLISVAEQWGTLILSDESPVLSMAFHQDIPPYTQENLQ